MEGISRPAGAGPTVDFGGEKLQVSGRTLRHWGEIEAQILAQRGDPFDGIASMVNSFTGRKDVLQLVVETAFDKARSWRFVTAEEVGAWFNEWDGICFSIWLSLRDNNPEKITLDYVTQVVGDTYEGIVQKEGVEAALQWRESLTDAIGQASGDDNLGKPTGGQP